MTSDSGSQVLRCTAFTALPWADILVALTLAGTDAYDLLPGPAALCELGELHEAEHATLVGDRDDIPDTSLWLLWTDSGFRLEWRPCCEEDGSKGDVCNLHAGHGSEHSWDVHDPTLDALRDELMRRYP